MADDLTRVNGIGEARAEKLKSIGISTFKQLSELSDAKVEELNEHLNLRNSIVNDDWRGSARQIMADDAAAALDADQGAGDDADANDDSHVDSTAAGDFKAGKTVKDEETLPAPKHADQPKTTGRARLNRDRPFNEVYGSEPGFDGAVKYEQNGKFFGPNDVEVRKA